MSAETPRLRVDALTAAQGMLVAQAFGIYIEAGGDPQLPHGDIYVLRFLLQCNWRLEAARALIIKAARWRAESGADAFRRKLEAGLSFCDHPYHWKMFRSLLMLPVQARHPSTGDSIKLRELGSLDASYFLGQVSDDEAYTFGWQMLEYDAYDADRHSAATGQLVMWVQVNDAAGLGLQSLQPRAIARFRAVTALAEPYYPEYLHLAISLDAPWIAVRLWNSGLKMVFSEKLRRRIHLLGSPTSDMATREALGKLVPLSVLPRAFGGELDAMSPESAEVCRLRADAAAPVPCLASCQVMPCLAPLLCT